MRGRVHRPPAWRAVAGLIAGIFLALPGLAQPRFIRGDTNDDGKVDLSDAVCTLLYLFNRTSQVCANESCPDALEHTDVTTHFVIP